MWKEPGPRREAANNLAISSTQIRCVYDLYIYRCKIEKIIIYAQLCNNCVCFFYFILICLFFFLFCFIVKIDTGKRTPHWLIFFFSHFSPKKTKKRGTYIYIYKYETGYAQKLVYISYMYDLWSSLLSASLLVCRGQQFRNPFSLLLFKNKIST